MKKTLCLLIAALLILGMLAGCNGTTQAPSNEGEPSTSTDPSQPGGSDEQPGDEPLKIISYANGAEPPVLEPVMSNYAATSILVYNLFCGLSRIGENGVAELAYAESYEVSDDGLVWTFKLRPDSKFSDGSELTMYDFEKSFKYMLCLLYTSPSPRDCS